MTKNSLLFLIQTHTNSRTMENKKLNLGKITITKLNNLHHIRGGQISFTVAPTLLNSNQTCMERTCPADSETNPQDHFTEFCP